MSEFRIGQDLDELYSWALFLAIALPSFALVLALLATLARTTGRDADAAGAEPSLVCPRCAGTDVVTTPNGETWPCLHTDHQHVDRGVRDRW